MLVCAAHWIHLSHFVWFGIKTRLPTDFWKFSPAQVGWLELALFSSWIPGPQTHWCWSLFKQKNSYLLRTEVEKVLPGQSKRLMFLKQWRALQLSGWTHSTLWIPLDSTSPWSVLVYTADDGLCGTQRHWALLFPLYLWAPVHWFHDVPVGQLQVTEHHWKDQ